MREELDYQPLTKKNIFSKCGQAIWNRRRKILTFLCLLPLKILIVHWFFKTDFWLTRMTEPVLVIQQPDLARCCLSSSDKQDVCGRTDCIPSSCPTPAPLDIDSEIGELNAFFIESAGHDSLSYRQSCAVESLALMNPKLTVHLLMTSEINMTSPTINLLVDNYPNIRISQIRLGDYIHGTPLEHWYFCTTWNYGSSAVSHLSDGLRFLTLSKYGGYYFDLDVIQMNPVTEFRNFVVAEDGRKVGSSVIHADFQHPIIRNAVEEFHTNYKRDVWAHNGPDLLTRLLKIYCGVDRVTSMTDEACRDFHILPPESYYPYWYLQWKEFFYDRGIDERPDWRLTDGPDGEMRTIGAHIWNSNSADYPVRKNSNQFYVQMAKDSCPVTLSRAPSEF